MPKPGGGTRLLERPGSPAVLVLRNAKLVVAKGPDRGREYPIEKPSFTIGTDTSNDLVLVDPTVSAHHAELSLDEQGYLLTDRQSTNGTFVAGFHVREIYLRDGSEVVIGDTVLKLRLLRGEIEIPLSSSTSFGELIGSGAAMRAVFAVLERAATTTTTVLLLGESGTGKELAARALHDQSPRRDAPYVVFDCGAITATLVESQLFGHVRGAFTGASEDRAGVFEEADTGTLVLDEIGELPLDLQPKLLRALEARAVQRVGEVKTRPVDVRIVACTNRNLEQEVHAGRFREDLFFRLSVIAVRLPPLRDRRDEIPRLVARFLERLGRSEPGAIPDSMMNALQAHSWPGNVRELRNVIERLVVLPDHDPLRSQLAIPRPAPASSALPFHEAKRASTDQFEREYLTRLLAEHGNISNAARAAGLSRQTCYRLMDKHGVKGE